MRIAGWQEALDLEFRAAAGRRFRWGHHDCCQFTACCIRAITGEDRTGLFAPYKSKREALQLLSEFGGMHALICHALGEPKPVSFATTGDIVLIDMGAGEQPAVCAGIESFAPGPRALTSRPTLTALAAWSV